MSLNSTASKNKYKILLSWEPSFLQILKVLFLTIFLVGFGSEKGFANDGNTGELSTIFHIYANGEYVGSLSDEAKLEQLKKDKLKQATSEYKELSFVLDTKISIIQERVFTAEVSDEVVLQQLQKLLSVQAEAIGIVIGEDEPILYVKDMSDYDEIIRQLKLQSVTEEELNEYEASKGSSTPLPPLEENETRITEIILSENVETVKKLVSPQEILPVEQAIVYLNKGTFEEKKYIVESGDHIGKIAQNHEMTTEQLLSLNPGITAETILQIGDEFNVTFFESFLEVEVHYESKSIQVMKFEKTTEEDNSLFKGDKKVTQEGSDGEKEVTELIRKRNGQIVGKSTLEEVVTKEPQKQITVIGTKVMPSRGTGTFKWPAVGGYISSQMGTRWGRQHNGIDIARPSSRTIKAADNGVVKSAGWDGAFGNKIVISHNNGYETLYAHLSSINVKVGQIVPQGASIGIMGSTGRSTGIHLHFEVTKNGSRINPMSVLK